ncbi:lipid-A-disaccharide synthase [Botrimarina hoheduenensis]|uniref:Lipid-A-disaccharide synthase n=1 Tax=Botrimarina hoheduenensis TaxID=2528000 RepID=A0A5C5WE87_9BACT|nr:lipid-A-disaccharide synthase [Botrimarina hoheduenensis]TWT48365.1 Glycosyl transferase [Botrimarina hoheduenensis]
MLPTTVFFSVGEPSGDLHGANLACELRSQAGEAIRCVGFGGPRMARAGVELHTDLTQHAVMGFVRVLSSIPQLLRLKRQAERYFREEKPDAVVLIDFPGFNWHIAKAAKKHGVPVFYYGTPQLWGWASWRVKKLRRNVDHALCKLPFEETWLRERGCNATYVGHPYFDELRTRKLDEAFVAQQRAQSGPLVTLLPGSRTQEVRANFAEQCAAAKQIVKSVPAARFAVAAFKDSHLPIIEAAIRQADFPAGVAPAVHVGRTPELIEAATCCVAVSGSVSLELLYHRKPTVIVYRISRLMHAIQKRFRRVRYITLVNLLTAAELFPNPVGAYDPQDPRDQHVLMPEYLACADVSAQLAEHVVTWLTDKAAYTRTEQGLRELCDRIGSGGASQRAAEYLLSALDRAPAQVAATRVA